MLLILACRVLQVVLQMQKSYAGHTSGQHRSKMHDFDADIDISCAHRLFLCAIPIRCAPDQSTCRYHHRIVPSLASHKLGRSL